MRAFVLSGGGNLGSMQVGALRALLERDYVPDIIVGCSAGAVNAAYLAREMSLAQIERLEDIWRSVRQSDVYPGTRLSAAGRFLSGKDSLYDNRRFYAFLQRRISSPVETFEAIGRVPLYITATHLRTGRLHVFGENVHDRILDALMASTALPPMHPPWVVEGDLYIDGGTVTPLPVRVAIDHGATEIFSLHIDSTTDEPQGNRVVRGVLELLNRSVLTMLQLQAEHDLLLARIARNVQMHYMLLHVARPPRQTDFSQADILIDHGHRIACEFLDAGTELMAVPAPAAQLRSRLVGLLLRTMGSAARARQRVVKSPADWVDREIVGD